MLLTPDFIFWCVFVFGFISFLWEFYLSYRQYCKHRDTVERPDDVRDLIDEESYRKARAYSLDKARFGFANDIWNAFENTVILLFNLIFVLWNMTGQYLNSWGYDGEILHSVVFLTVASMVDLVINTPWKIYHTFVIEQKHGFNKQTFRFFVVDQIKKQLLMLVISVPLTAVILWIIQKGGDYFFLFLWVFLLIFTFFLMTIYPEFIAPLFDKYTPLKDGELKTKIEALAAKVDFPLKKLYVVEGSKRSAHSNAYMYGFWNNKRIVLYDTLIADYSPLNDDNKNGSEKAAKSDNSVTTLESSSEAAANNLEKDDQASDKSRGSSTASSRKEEEEKKSTSSASNGEWEKPDITTITPGEEHPDDGVSGVVVEQDEETLLNKQNDEQEHQHESKPVQKKLGMSDDEVVAVLGHELGHWKLKHTVYNLVVAEVNMLFCMVIFSYLYKRPVLYAAFGFTNSQPMLVGLMIIFVFIFAPYNEVLNFIMTWWSRRCEFAADRFAAELGFSGLLESGLVKLSKDNLSLPVDDWLFSAWHHGHPPVVERVSALKKFQ